MAVTFSYAEVTKEVITTQMLFLWMELMRHPKRKCCRVRLLRLLYTCTFLPSQTLRKQRWTFPASRAAEVRRFKWLVLSDLCSVLTNRKFPQSFHHRKFPVRKPLLHKQRAPQHPYQTPTRACRGGKGRVGRQGWM